MKNKKGTTTFEILMWIPRLMFLVVVMFTVMYLIRTYVTTTIDISELQANVFVNRVLYSPTSISYFDSDIGRLYPGIIEFDKFESQITEKSLEKSIYYGEDNKEAGAKFILKDLNENKELTAFYNEDFFKEQKKLVDAGYTKGPGGARGYDKKYDVLIFKNKALYRGLLTIEVAIPNS